MDIDQWLENLRRSDRNFYNMLAMEIWAIAQTMDNLLPGFWSHFMENRHLALQEFIRLKQPEPETASPESAVELNNDPSTAPPSTDPHPPTV